MFLFGFGGSCGRKPNIKQKPHILGADFGYRHLIVGCHSQLYLHQLPANTNPSRQQWWLHYETWIGILAPAFGPRPRHRGHRSHRGRLGHVLVEGHSPPFLSNSLRHGRKWKESQGSLSSRPSYYELGFKRRGDGESGGEESTSWTCFGTLKLKDLEVLFVHLFSS